MLIACSEPRVPQDSGVKSTSKQRLKLARYMLTALILFGLIFVSHVSLSSTNVVRTDYVVDSTSFISEYRFKKINRRLVKHHTKHHDEIVVGIIPSLGPDSASAKLDELMDAWRVGGDNERGMLILLILDAQQVHTESGQRLAPRVPNDALRSFTSKVVETGFEPKALGRKLDRYLGKLLRNIEHQDPIEESSDTASQSETTSVDRHLTPSIPNDAPPISNYQTEDAPYETEDRDESSDNEDILLRIQDWFEDKVILLVLIGLASRPVADFLLFTKILLGEIFKLNEDSLIITLLSWIWFIVFGYFQIFISVALSFIGLALIEDFFGSSPPDWFGIFLFLGILPISKYVQVSASGGSDDLGLDDDLAFEDDFEGGGGTFGGGGASGSW